MVPTRPVGLEAEKWHGRIATHRGTRTSAGRNAARALVFEMARARSLVPKPPFRDLARSDETIHLEYTHVCLRAYMCLQPFDRFDAVLALSEARGALTEGRRGLTEGAERGVHTRARTQTATFQGSLP